MDKIERKYWIAFSTFVNFGPKRFKLLREYFGNAQKAWQASEKELREIGLSEKLISSFIIHRSKLDIDLYLDRIDKLNINILTINDSNYPKLLKETDDAPYILYIKSQILQPDIPVVTSKKTKFQYLNMSDLFNFPAVTVVGTRRVTSYGVEVTEKLTASLVFNEIMIVSGMARGVDSIAHKTAINNKGKTIAVLGSGLDIIYPPENRELYNSIVASGAVISEFPLGFRPAPWCFPLRDRIMAGMSLGVLVTEAAISSGSLITASRAGDYGREVFAVPGPITSCVSEGTSRLLKKGAKLVTSVTDILEELNLKLIKSHLEARKVLPETKVEKLIIDILGSEQLHINNIVLKSKLPISRVASLLMMMEMKGMVRSYGNGMYGKK